MMSFLSHTTAYIGMVVVFAGAALGVVLILAMIAAALSWGFARYIRRIGNVSSNWTSMVRWVAAGRPTWKLVDNPDRPGTHYMRMVPQDGPAIDIPEIVPVRVHERLDALIETAERHDREDATGEGWLQLAYDLRELKALLEK